MLLIWVLKSCFYLLHKNRLTTSSTRNILKSQQLSSVPSQQTAKHSFLIQQRDNNSCHKTAGRQSKQNQLLNMEKAGALLTASIQYFLSLPWIHNSENWFQRSARTVSLQTVFVISCSNRESLSPKGQCSGGCCCRAACMRLLLETLFAISQTILISTRQF